MRSIIAVFTGVVVLAWLSTSSADTGSTNARAAIVKRAKAASAYLFVKLGADRELASAFCIHSSGIFVTCKHVVDAAHGTDNYNLVLKSGEEGERIISAHVLRTSDDADLAILKADQPGPYDALELGDSDALVETDELLTFGFPFGEALSATEQSNPNITVSSGHVTSLRKFKGELDAIQLDASLNPGNSGGPILDMSGRVVGIVSGGIQGAALNFAAPVNKLRAMMKTPVVSLSPTTLAYKHRSDPATFTIHVDALVPDPRKFDVTLALGESNSPPSLPAGRAPDGTYVVNVVPVPGSDGRLRLRIIATFKGGSVSGITADRDLKVAGASMHLRDIRSIDRVAGACVTTSDRIINGEPSDLGTVQVDLDDSHASLNLSHAEKMEVRQIDSSPDRLAYRIGVRAGTELVTESSGTIEIVGSPRSDAVASTSWEPSRRRQPPAPVEVSKSKLALDRVVIRLPGELDDIEPAAQGRLLILHFAGLHQFALFDTAAAKIVSYIPISAEHILYAAGEHKLVVVRPADNVIERFDLGTGAKELTVATPVAPTAIAMGCASDGPVCVFYNSKACEFLDLQTLQPIQLTRDTRADHWNDGGALRVRAAADGSAFAAWAPGDSPAGLRFLALEGDRLVYRYAAVNFEPVVPSFDGSLLFTPDGLLKPSQIQNNPGEFEGPGSIALLATYSPAFYVSIDHQGTVQGIPGNWDHRNITLFTSSGHRSLITLPDVAEATNPFGRMSTSDALTSDKRLHVMPDQGVIITLPTTNDQLVLHHFNLLKLLNETGIDYLFAESVPPNSVAQGADFSYQIAVRSKRGGVTFHLESGPGGMKISPTGLVTWRVPDTTYDDPVAVIISIKDASGQEIYHNLSLTIRAQTVQSALRPGSAATAPSVETAIHAPGISVPDLSVAKGGLSKAEILQMLRADRVWYWHWEQKNRKRPFRFVVTQDGAIRTSESPEQQNILEQRWVLFHNGHCLVPINTQKFEGFFIKTGREVGAFTDDALTTPGSQTVLEGKGLSNTEIIRMLQADRTWYWHWEQQDRSRPFKFTIEKDGRIFASDAPNQQDSLERRWVLFHNGHCLIPMDSQTINGFFIETGRQVDAFTDQKLIP